ncbi:MAG: alpha-L-fucosidase [Bacteroidales bacterium]|nr:alpha-L-fucosidase [Bacteroidales bacterium]
MTKKLLFFIGMLLILIGVKAQDEVEPTWESINRRGYPQWFSDAKLGIFIHWGVYSVPAYASKEGYAEWYYRGLMTQDSVRVDFQKRNYGVDFQYKDFDKMFKAELWNPDDWAELFRKSGARYVLLVTKHHDGYCLWNSKYAPGWNSVEGGPKRDIVGELTDAVRKKGLKMGFYYSLPEWTNPLHIWCLDSPDSIGNYVDNHMIPQFKELVSTYRPSVVFTDGEWWNTSEQWHARELISWYYNLVGDEAVVNDRWGSGCQHGFRTPEYSSGITATDRPWAECRGLGRSFGLNRNEPLSNYLTSDELIRHFVQLVSAGGGMTLNVGPSADGIIPLLQQERLIDLGKWLQINGEAIYDTRPLFVDGKPKFNDEKPVSVSRHDETIDFDWVRNSPDKLISCDNFNAVWTGTFTSEKTDVYTFDVEVDDNVKVTIGDNVVIDYVKAANEESQSNAEESETKNLTTGKIKLKKGVSYPVKVEYQEINVNAMIKLYVSSKDEEKQIFRPDNGFDAVYSCMQPYVCYTTKDGALYAIAIEFPQDELILNIPKPAESVKVTMLGCDKILPWRYENGKMIIDTTPLKYSDLKSTAAWSFKIY